MSFKNAKIEISYKTFGEITISQIINPLLKDTKTYMRSVGFFSSSSFSILSEGINAISNKENTIIQLITSTKIDQDDIEAINKGYDIRELIEQKFILEYTNFLNEIKEEHLRLLVKLIAEKKLEIKVAITKTNGMYHDKVAILVDEEDNMVAFVGSNNETYSGYMENYEKVRVFKNWIDHERVQEEFDEFQSMWNNENDYLDIHDFRDSILQTTINVAEERSGYNKKKEIKLYDYQEQAIKSWVDNNYTGFFVMATGTGKTITALFAAKNLIEKNNPIFVIVVPYIHLVSQWRDDVNNIFKDAQVVLVSGQMPEWDIKIKDAIISKRFDPKKKIVIITTQASFMLHRFNDSLKNYKGDRILLVDEAHNFVNNIDKRDLFDIYKFKIGLSATPIFGTNKEKTRNLVNFFGGVVFELPIEAAIGKHLVNYTYNPIFVYATEEEENKYNYYLRQIASCYDPKTGILRDVEKFLKSRRAKLRVIGMAENKTGIIENVIKSMQTIDHFIIYCSDGTLGNDESIKHLRHVVNLLNDLEYKPSQFTAQENMDEREKLIKAFDGGRISTLVAIRCLDEGINIPSIKNALILSSNDNYREFVQRRGRILRKHPGKDIAHIYDIIVLPNSDLKDMAKIELKRYYEYGRLATNWQDIKPDFDRYLVSYGLTLHEVEIDSSIDYEEESLDD